MLSVTQEREASLDLRRARLLLSPQARRGSALCRGGLTTQERDRAFRIDHHGLAMHLRAKPSLEPLLPRGQLEPGLELPVGHRRMYLLQQAPRVLSHITSPSLGRAASPAPGSGAPAAWPRHELPGSLA